MADYPLAHYRERLHDERLECDAQRIARAVLKVLRESGDNLDILAAVRRELVASFVVAPVE